jgi:hypothetical protein
MPTRRESGGERGLRWMLAIVALSAAMALAPAAVATAAPASGGVVIKVLSNRADLVSDGDALVEIVRPAGTNPDSVRVELNGQDIADDFAVRPDGRFVGLVDGLEEGDNLLTAAVHQRTAKLTITDYPIGGPIFSGPHLKPWLCTTVANGLGDPVDAQCNAPTKVDFFYRPQGGGALQPYDPSNPPGDVATTTTDEGETVPFIVRRERGTMDRGIYDVAVLFDPDEPWQPWDPQNGWNGKVVWPFGPAAGTLHSQGSPQPVLDPQRLGEGFMVATHSLNVHNTNLNTVVSAESVTMLKEHIIETYGPIRYVIGQGGSGASIQQQLIANDYPGLLDGILPALSFPDTWTTGTEVVNCMLLNSYFNQNATLWPAADRSAATGHQSGQSCVVWQLAFSGPTNPTDGCGLPPGTEPDRNTMYHPTLNPIGVRCTAQDYMVNIWGRREGDGFAKRAGTNIGLQYGLKALLNGRITAEQFVDLNDEIGSLDIDGVLVPGERLPSDPGATRIAYRSGQVNDASQLDRVPMIDLRPSENNGIHTNFHSWEMKERLKQANGDADNQVVFFSPGGLPASAGNEAFDLMDQWLSNIEDDHSGASLEDKVVADKPAGAVDACFINGQKITDQDLCLQQAPFFGAPTIAAGGDLANESIECQLKPLERSDYPDGTFTDGQWARLEDAFPSGVCDLSKPPADSERSIPWMSFADGPGGEPLGDPPKSIPGCVGGSQGHGNAGPGGCPGRGG